VGGSDPNVNPRLAQELEHAKSGMRLQAPLQLTLENMSKDSIGRAIARGQPRSLGSDLVHTTYEAVLPGGVAIIMYMDRTSFASCTDMGESVRR